MTTLYRRSNASSFLFILLIILTLYAPATAQRVNDLRIIRSDSRAIELEVTPNVTLRHLNSGELLPRISSARIANLGHPGEPMQMQIVVSLALPAPEGNSLEVLSVEYNAPVQGRIAPVPSLHQDSKGFTSESYTVDPAAYAKPLKGGPIAELHYQGLARDLHSGAILIEPYQFDPATNTLRFLRSIKLRVRYASAPAARGVRQEPSELTRAVFINSDVVRNWTVAPSATPAFARRAATSSARAWMRVTVKEEGLYALTADDFRKAGIDISSLDGSHIAIYGGDGGDLPESQFMADSNRLHQVPTIIDRDGSGHVTQVLFYGTGPLRWKNQAGDTVPIHALSPYVTANSYIVAIDGDASRSFTNQQVPGGTPTAFPTSAYTSVVNDEDKVNIISTDYISGSGRGWFGTQFVSDGANADTRTFATPLPGLDRSSPVNYRVRVAHSGYGDGFFTISQDQIQLGSPIPLGSRGAEETVAVAIAQRLVGDANAIPGDITSLLRISYTSKVQSSGFLDYFEIHYARHLALESSDNDRIAFEAATGNGSAEYHVSGFSGDDLVGFDVNDPANPLLLVPSATSGGTFVFRDFLFASGQSHRYFITRRSAVKHVDDIMPTAFGDLRDQMLNADILVITHPDFKDAAQKYVDYRNGQHRFTAAYVTTEQIYTEFSHGNLDPTSLRDYIAFAYKNWTHKPSYVLLLGDGTYDYRNLVSQQKQLVPTYETDDGNSYNTTYSEGYDDYFARVVGNQPDDAPLDLAIGRLPVETPDQADAVIEKIKRYENSQSRGTWRQTIILTADDDFPLNQGYGFVGQSEEMWRQLPTWLEPKKIYEPTYPTIPTATSSKPGAAQDLLDFMNAGAVITNWVGHGNPDVWSHESLLNKDQFIPKLYNNSMLTFITAMTCNFCHFDNPNKVSGGELFVRNPSGAIAVMTASRAAIQDANADLMYRYTAQLFKRDPVTHRFPTIGQALFALKKISDGDNDQKYMVFGDPALYLDLPQDSVVIETINMKPVLTDTTTVASLSLVKVEGRICDQFGKTDAGFNGTALVSLYDADRHITIAEIPEDKTNILFYGGRLFRGPAIVTNGRFTATFRVPKDIAYDSTTARLHIYAFNNEMDAAGATNHIRVYGSDTGHIADHHGPDIHIFLDDRSFRSGDLVTSTPLLIVDLADSSGINSSGSGLGHHIEAWLDGAVSSIDLSDNYQTQPTDYSKGTVQRRLLALAPGEHQVRVRAWDIYNNAAEGTVYFRIGEGADSVLAVEDVVNYPNPMTRETDFTFRHNQSGALDVEVGIYTLSGRKLRQLTEHGVSGRFVRVHWDGTDADGQVLANGVYLYKLKVKTAASGEGATNGEGVFETIEKLAVVR